MRTRVVARGLCVGVVALASVGCPHPFLAANFQTEYLPRTHSFALAPIANLSTEPEGVKAGLAIREAIYFELSRRQDNYTVAIQDIALTDQKLHAAGLNDSVAARMPGPDLARLLGVDAVMRGSVTRYKKKGAGGQIVTAVLFGFASGSEVKADVAIYDGADGRMIWQHNVDKAGAMFSSPDALRNSVGRDVARKFPYKKATD
ncbi:MAG TPA: hypothetical protein VGQ25_00700 [Gemmatimonadales bacterium]|jgi:hypothetical protein|nr:hypothetical protein [Gemmatimonadales bacterium]